MSVARRETFRDQRKYLIKDILQFILSQGGAFDVFHRSKLLGHPIPVFLPDGLHFLTGEFFADGGVIPEIGLGADNQAGDTGAVVMDFGEPFLPDVLKGGGGSDGEADQEDIGLGV